MKIKVRDSRDPFTQALAYLFKTRGDAPELRQKMRGVMIPLVTQVAVKVDAIDTEQSVRDKALPVFTGVISLHLADIVNGKECDEIEEWVKQITTYDLQTLFRKGYSLIDGLVRNVSIQKKDDPFFRIQTFAERMREYSTHVENGEWSGYKFYQNKLSYYQGEKVLDEFAEWLSRKAGVIFNPSLVNTGGTVDMSSTIVSRVIFSIMHSDRISVDINLKGVRAIVDSARTTKNWWSRAEKRCNKFIEGLPHKFIEALDHDTQIFETFSYVLT